MISKTKKLLFMFVASFLCITPHAQPLTPTQQSWLIGGAVGACSSFVYYKYMVNKYKEKERDDEEFRAKTFFNSLLVGGCLGIFAGRFAYGKLSDTDVPADGQPVPATYGTPQLTYLPAALTMLQRQRPTPGLANLGNSCFMNAALQTEFNSPRVRNALLTSCDAGCKSSAVVSYAVSLLHEALASNRSSVAPTQFHRLVRNSYFDGQFGAQEDSALFLNSLSDDLGGPLSPSPAYPNTHVGRCLRYDKLDKLYRLKIGKEIVCSGCSAVSYRVEDERGLSLSINNQKSVVGALNNYLAKNNLQGDEQYNCATCGNVDAQERFRFERLPKRLPLHLKRFDNFGVKNNDGLKIAKKIKVPYVTGIVAGKRTFCFQEYELQGFQVHRGRSLNSGHYVAYVKDPASNQWYLYNDSVRTPVDPATINKILTSGLESGGGTPYVICYEKKLNRVSFDDPLAVCSY